MKMKALCLAVITACLVSASAFAGAIRMRMAHVNSEQTTFQKGLEKFKELIEERSGGRIEAKIFANAQLGNERDNIEGLQMGTIDVAVFSTAPVSAFVPSFDLLSAPMVFRDFTHAFKVADGPIGKRLDEELLAKQQIRNLGYIDTGARHVYSTRPVKSIADFNGLKTRVMENSLHMDTFTAFGAIPTPMASGDVFTALSQGTIDAAENTMQYINTMKMYEVCKYVTKTAHFYGIMMICISERTFNKLDDELKKIVLDAGREAALYQRKVSDEENVIAEKSLRDMGVQIDEIDRDALAATLAPVFEKYKAVLDPKIMEEIRAQ